MRRPSATRAAAFLRVLKTEGASTGEGGSDQWRPVMAMGWRAVKSPKRSRAVVVVEPRAVEKAALPRLGLGGEYRDDDVRPAPMWRRETDGRCVMEPLKGWEGLCEEARTGLLDVDACRECARGC